MQFARLAPLALTLMMAGPAFAQGGDPDVAAKRTGTAPAGWDLRLDREGGDPLSVDFKVGGGNGMRVTTGPAAIFWNAKSRTSGPFVAEATFTQLKKPAHPEAYGLIWGGENLKAANQSYFYLIVRGDGKYMVKHRAGAETHELVPWTEHAAIAKEGADGKAKNVLKVESSAGGVKLSANGQLLRQLDAGATADGLAGIRVNHNLEVQVDGFEVRKP
jgi:hypothetical protein